jgi:polyketide cyclase/dehydrase/lipid transport protein
MASDEAPNSQVSVAWVFRPTEQARTRSHPYALAAAAPRGHPQLREGRCGAGLALGERPIGRAEFRSRVRCVRRVEASHRYEFPVERGFSFVTDTANWPTFWPGYVRLEEGSRWGAAGDTARLTTRLLGRERELAMVITVFEPNRLVTYTSTQQGLPDASHERHFEPNGEGFVYRLVVEYEPRVGAAGVFDRLLLARGIRRAFEQTFRALEREFARF